MSYQTLQVEDAQGIVTLVLNRPEKRNALSAQMIDELTRFAAHEGARARAVILTGAGDVFCAGGDLTWMQAQIEADRATRMAEARKLAMMLKALNVMPAPLIAAVQGGAFGGGVGMACVADIAIAAEGTKFGLTETRLGLIPATISPYVIARMGEGRARQVFMSSRIFGADEAAALGIVARVVPSDGLVEAADREARAYLSCAPGAVGAAKALARALGPRIDDAIIDDTITRLADTWEQPEAAEGIAAFLEKRKPGWSASN
jgi:methylglutaconyl-CoA hydratase